MADNFFKIKNGLTISPSTTAPATEGDVAVSDSIIRAHLGGSIRDVVTDDQTQTLTNKTIDGASNTITGLTASSLSDGSITTAKLSDGTVTAAKLASGAAANTALSNLTTTSINQDLLPDTDNTRNLGSAAKRMANVTSAQVTTPSITAPAGSNIDSYTNSGLAGHTQFDSTGVYYVFADTEIQLDAPVDMRTFQIKDMSDPTDPQDATTKFYVDNKVWPTANISDSAITTAKISNAAVTGAKILDGEISNAKVGVGANIDRNKLASGTANAVVINQGAGVMTDLAPGAEGSVLTISGGAPAFAFVTVSDGSITTAKLSDQSVTTAKLSDLAVTTAKISDGSVTAAKLDPSISLTPSDGSITTVKLSDSAVTTVKISDLAVTTAKISDGSVTAAKLDPSISLTPSDGSITTAKLSDSAVTTVKISDLAVTTAKISDASVTTAKIGLNNHLEFPNATKPTTPSSGRVRLFSAPDKKLYYENADGTLRILDNTADQTNLTILDSTFVASNQENSDVEAGVGTHAVYADAAGTSPVDMTGGSPGTTLTRSSSSPLNGLYSLVLDLGSGSSRQGEGHMMDVYVPPAYRTSRLEYSFAFSITGTVVEDDLRLAVYDVTNAALITDLTHVNKVMGSSGVARVQFPVSSNTAQIRVGLHIARTSTGSLSVKMDDFRVSPKLSTIGLAGSDTISYTPTWTAATTNPAIGNGTLTGYYSRKGDRLVTNIYLLAGSTTTFGSGAWFFSLPAGLTIDTTKLPSVNTNAQSLGITTALDSGTAVYHNNIVYNNTSSVKILAATSGSAYQSNQPFTWTTSDALSLNFEVPISGWSANVTMASSSQFKVSSYLANGTRVTGSAPTRLGEYRSYLRNSSAATFTETNGSPAASPSTADGIRIYNGNAWGTADTNNNPTRYEIYVGVNKNVKLEWYASSGRTGFVDASPYTFGTTSDVGYVTNYDKVTGIVTISAQLYATSGRTDHASGTNAAGIAVNDPYFDIVVSENALAVGVDSARSELRFDSRAGYGSTATKIPYFTTTTTNTGTAYSFVNTSTDGLAITLIEPGVYTATYQDIFSISDNMGVSSNGTVTTGIASTTAANRLGYCATNVAGEAAAVTVTFIGTPGQVIRPHTDSANGTTQANAMFRITKVSN